MNNYIKNYLNNNYNFKNINILVLGPGRSKILETIIQINNPRLIDLIDHNEDALVFQKNLLKNYPKIKINFYNAEFSKENSIDFLKNEYDLIFCTEVLEHVSNNFILLNRCNELLNNNGLLFVSVPNKIIDIFLLKINNNYMHNDTNDIGHLNFYNKQEFKTLLRNNGFNIVKFKGLASEYVFYHTILALNKVKIDEDTGQILEPNRMAVKLGKILFNIIRLLSLNKFLNYFIPRNFIAIACKKKI
jgi:2-polyprenyl-3-methyl-5-hydroxy-6-metoxy-1,4-benzoquinol methylase